MAEGKSQTLAEIAASKQATAQRIKDLAYNKRMLKELADAASRSGSDFNTVLNTLMSGGDANEKAYNESLTTRVGGSMTSPQTTYAPPNFKEAAKALQDTEALESSGMDPKYVKQIIDARTAAHNAKARPTTGAPPTDGKPPAGQPPTDGKPPTDGVPPTDGKPKVPADTTTSSTTAAKTVSQRITELEATGKKVIGREEAVPAGYEFVSTIAGQKVIEPLRKTATGETIPEPSQESLRAPRRGPDYASESTADLMERARQAKNIVTGVTEDNTFIGGRRVARDEYNKIRQTLADRKTTNEANAATAAVQASADRVKNYGEARDKYQAGMSTDDKTFQSLDENKDRLWNSMTSDERSKAVHNIILKGQAADKAAAAAQTSKPAQTSKRPPIEEEKKNALRTARSIFGK